MKNSKIRTLGRSKSGGGGAKTHLCPTFKSRGGACPRCPLLLRHWPVYKHIIFHKQSSNTKTWLKVRLHNYQPRKVNWSHHIHLTDGVSWITGLLYCRPTPLQTFPSEGLQHCRPPPEDLQHCRPSPGSFATLQTFPNLYSSGLVFHIYREKEIGVNSIYFSKKVLTHLLCNVISCTYKLYDAFKTSSSDMWKHFYDDLRYSVECLKIRILSKIWEVDNLNTTCDL